MMTMTMTSAAISSAGAGRGEESAKRWWRPEQTERWQTCKKKANGYTKYQELNHNKRPEYLSEGEESWLLGNRWERERRRGWRGWWGWSKRRGWLVLVAEPADVFGDVFGGGRRPCRQQQSSSSGQRARHVCSPRRPLGKWGAATAAASQSSTVQCTSPPWHTVCWQLSGVPVVDAMQDTETGTSNADISGSTRAIEVSLAQGHSTKRSASNGTIKRGGQIFGQIGQICKAIALQILKIQSKNFYCRFWKY